MAWECLALFMREFALLLVSALVCALIHETISRVEVVGMERVAMLQEYLAGCRPGADWVHGHRRSDLVCPITLRAADVQVTCARWGIGFDCVGWHRRRQQFFCDKIVTVSWDFPRVEAVLIVIKGFLWP